MSLEEYEAMVAERKARLNTTREPAVKVDAAQFKGMTVATKVGAGLWISTFFQSHSFGAWLVGLGGWVGVRAVNAAPSRTRRNCCVLSRPSPPPTLAHTNSCTRAHAHRWRRTWAWR